MLYITLMSLRHNRLLWQVKTNVSLSVLSNTQTLKLNEYKMPSILANQYMTKP